MKVKEIKTYQVVRFSGSIGVMDYVNIYDPRRAGYKMRLVDGIGVEIIHPYNAAQGVQKFDTVIVPYTNIAYLKLDNEDAPKAESKASEAPKAAKASASK